MRNNRKDNSTAFDDFCKLPNSRELIRKAGVELRADEQDAKIDYLHDRLFESEENRRLEKSQHEREIDLMTQAAGLATALPHSKITVKRLGRDALDPVIDVAVRNALAPDEYQSVFAEMLKMADGPNRLVPLIGAATSTGIPYRSSAGEKKSFTAGALKKRLKNRSKL